MADKRADAVRDVLLEVIENQMRENRPPITRETYGRLIAEGHSHAEAMKLIGCALSTVLFEDMKHNRDFDEERYAANLKALPELPWERE